jgi:heme-degrading monooxygenase HmoA
MYVIIWSFQTTRQRRRKFEAVYGPAGKWAELFRQSPDYIGTELLQSDDVPGLYLTIDRWKSEEAYLDFLEVKEAEYTKMDNLCEKMTVNQEFLGRYVA